MGLFDKLASFARRHPNDDAIEVAKLFIEELTPGELIDLLAEEIAHHQRNLMRAQERRAFAAWRGRARPGTAWRGVASQDKGPFAALFAVEFKLGDGRSVPWLKATVAEHQQRITLLERLRAGLDETIKRHQDAIALIQESGVTCLAEIGDAA